MKILLLVDDYLPDSIKVAAIMMHDLAKQLQLEGHDVSVCVPDEFLPEKFTINNYEGICVIRFKSGPLKNISKIKRAINETFLSFKAWLYLRKFFKQNKHDLIVYYSPTIFFGKLVQKLKNSWRCKSFLILRDVFPQWTVDNGLIVEGSLIHRYFKYFESVNYDAADVIAVQSPSNKLFFMNNISYSKYIDKLSVLYNWSDTKLDVKLKKSYRKKLDLVGKVVFFYGGNIGHAQDMMNIVRLAQSLSDYPEAHFLLVGKGDEVELILDYIKINKIENVTYLNSVSQNEYIQMLAEFDIGLFSLHKNHKTHNFPGKLLGYMKYSKPILGSVNSGNDLADVLSVSRAGLVTNNGDDSQFLKNAIQLIESPEMRDEMGDNANRLLNDKFSVKAAVNVITHSYGN